MLRTYVAKKPKTYTEEDVKRAVVLVVEDGQSTLSAAKEMGVPYETVNRWMLKGVPNKIGSGGKRVLSASKEELIAVALNKCGGMGWPIGFEDIKPMVKSYLDSLGRKTCFKDNTW